MLDAIITRIEGVKYYDAKEIDYIIQSIRISLKNVIDEDRYNDLESYLTNFQEISKELNSFYSIFGDISITDGIKKAERVHEWNNSRNSILNFLNIIGSQLIISTSREEVKMNSETRKKLVSDQLKKYENTRYGDDELNKEIFDETEIIIRNFFGEKSNEYKKFVGFGIPATPTRDPMQAEVERREGFERDKAEKIALLKKILKELDMFGNIVSETETTKAVVQKSVMEKVFIVHGHDVGMREYVARTIKNLGLDPVILREQAIGGRTIIEQIEEHSNVGFAVVLLSPDDKVASNEKEQTRARQNVIFELGFFIGRLGRGHTVTLLKQDEGFEMPSDYQGVIFIPFDDQDGWKMKLGKELKASGYVIDLNDL